MHIFYVVKLTSDMQDLLCAKLSCWIHTHGLVWSRCPRFGTIQWLYCSENFDKWRGFDKWWMVGRLHYSLLSSTTQCCSHGHVLIYDPEKCKCVTSETCCFCVPACKSCVVWLTLHMPISLSPIKLDLNTSHLKVVAKNTSSECQVSN